MNWEIWASSISRWITHPPSVFAWKTSVLCTTITQDTEEQARQYLGLVDIWVLIMDCRKTSWCVLIQDRHSSCWLILVTSSALEHGSANITQGTPCHSQHDTSSIYWVYLSISRQQKSFSTFQIWVSFQLQSDGFWSCNITETSDKPRCAWTTGTMT